MIQMKRRSRWIATSKNCAGPSFICMLVAAYNFSPFHNQLSKLAVRLVSWYFFIPNSAFGLFSVDKPHIRKIHHCDQQSPRLVFISHSKWTPQCWLNMLKIWFSTRKRDCGFWGEITCLHQKLRIRSYHS